MEVFKILNDSGQFVVLDNESILEFFIAKPASKIDRTMRVHKFELSINQVSELRGALDHWLNELEWREFDKDKAEGKI